MANVQAFRLIASRHEGSIDAFLDSIDPLIDSSAMEPHNATRVDQLHSSSERGTVVEGLRTWSREKRLSQGRPKRR